jgi:chromosome segregation ATPase
VIKEKASLDEFIKQLEEEKEQLKKEIQSLNSTVNELKEVLQHLQNKNEKMRKKHKIDKGTINHLESKIDIFQSLIGHHDQLIQNFEHENAHLQERLNTLKSKNSSQIALLKSKIHQLKQEKGDNIVNSTVQFSEIQSINEEYIHQLEKEKEQLMQEIDNLNEKHNIFQKNISKQLSELNKRISQEEENHKLQE